MGRQPLQNQIDELQRQVMELTRIVDRLNQREPNTDLRSFGVDVRFAKTSSTISAGSSASVELLDVDGDSYSTARNVTAYNNFDEDVNSGATADTKLIIVRVPLYNNRWFVIGEDC